MKHFKSILTVILLVFVLNTFSQPWATMPHNTWKNYTEPHFMSNVRVSDTLGTNLFYLHDQNYYNVFRFPKTNRVDTFLTVYKDHVYKYTIRHDSIFNSASLPSGRSGQTIYNNGTSWGASSLITNNGTNVGINTTNPSQMLDVNGNIGIHGSIVFHSPGVLIGDSVTIGTPNGMKFKITDSQVTYYSANHWIPLIQDVHFDSIINQYNSLHDFTPNPLPNNFVRLGDTIISYANSGIWAYILSSNNLISGFYAGSLTNIYLSGTKVYSTYSNGGYMGRACLGNFNALDISSSPFPQYFCSFLDKTNVLGGDFIVSNNIVYGVTGNDYMTDGSDYGYFYKFDLSTPYQFNNLVTKITTFSGMADIMSCPVAIGNNLYYMSGPGSNGTGLIGHYNTTNGSYTIDYNFPSTTGNSNLKLTAVGNILYGVGVNITNSAPTLFKYDLSNGSYTVLHNFIVNESQPSKLIVNNNEIYGYLVNRDIGKIGYLFSYNLLTNTFTKLYQPSDDIGSSISFGNLLTYNNIIYGGIGAVLYSFNSSVPSPLINLVNNATNIITGSGTISSLTMNFPQGASNDKLSILLNNPITNNILTGSGINNLLYNTSTTSSRTFFNYNKRWY